jgi:hypothetical protein
LDNQFRIIIFFCLVVFYSFFGFPELSIVSGLAAELNSDIEQPIELFYGLRKEDLFRIGEVLGLTAIVAIFFVVVGYLLNEIRFAVVSWAERKFIENGGLPDQQCVSNRYVLPLLILIFVLIYLMGNYWIGSPIPPINWQEPSSGLTLVCGLTKKELLRPTELVILMILSSLTLAFVIRPILLIIAAIGKIIFSPQQSRMIFWFSGLAPFVFLVINQSGFWLELIKHC